MLHCTADQHSTPSRALHIIPTNPLTSANMHHGNYVCKIHTIHMHIHTFMHANSKICTIEYCADAVQTARNSASGWNQTSSSCLCSCAPLHHTRLQQCHGMLQGMQQTIPTQRNLDHLQCSYATLPQVPHATIQMLLLPSQLARHLALELG